MSIEHKITITNKYGLHARPATEFVKVAKGFKSNVTIIKDGQKANAKSIMEIMILAIEKGSKILLRIDGEDEERACEALEKILLRDEKEG